MKEMWENIKISWEECSRKKKQEVQRHCGRSLAEGGSLEQGDNFRSKSSDPVRVDVTACHSKEVCVAGRGNKER